MKLSDEWYLVKWVLYIWRYLQPTETNRTTSSPSLPWLLNLTTSKSTTTLAFPLPQQQRHPSLSNSSTFSGSGSTPWNASSSTRFQHPNQTHPFSIPKSFQSSKPLSLTPSNTFPLSPATWFGLMTPQTPSSNTPQATPFQCWWLNPKLTSTTCLITHPTKHRSHVV